LLIRQAHGQSCTALFGGILYCEPCGDLEHGEISGTDHDYESYTRTTCAAEFFATPHPSMAIKSRSLNGQLSTRWTNTVLFGGVLYREPCGDLEHGEISGADHGYGSYTRTACASGILPPSHPFIGAQLPARALVLCWRPCTVGLGDCTRSWAVWMAPLTDGTMVACVIIVCTLAGGRRHANGTCLVPRVRAHSILRG
jgi:hypothetical protein